MLSSRLSDLRRLVASWLSASGSFSLCDLHLKLTTHEHSSKYFIYCKVAYDYHEVSDKIAEPIIDILSLGVDPKNLLVSSPPLADGAPPTTKTRSYPISMCETTRLDESFWRLVPRIPSLNRLIDDIAQVRRVKVKFQLPPIDSLKLRQALTPPSAGTGYDYQYLETVGDSFLK